MWPVVKRHLFARLEAKCAPSPTGCWEWTACITRGGYGAIQLDGKKVGAHRAMMQAVHGHVPPSMYVCHRCDNKRCINPDHLFFGTAVDNARDRASKGRSFKPTGAFNVMSKVGARLALAMKSEIQSGQRIKDVAQRYGLHPATVKKHAGICVGRFGARASNVKLTEQQVSEIRDLLKTGVSQSELGRRYGVSSHAIWRIANGKGWHGCN